METDREVHDMETEVRDSHSPPSVPNFLMNLSQDKFIRKLGTEGGEWLIIIELMITSHSHEFTQILQMKSYHE